MNIRRIASLALLLAGALAHPAPTSACSTTAVTPNTPTGIAGCERSGVGIASHYGPGNGVAMNFCTWAIRHSTGCGWVTIQSNDTGIVVTVPVVDFCDCYTGTERERVVDLQWGVVDALGLDRSRGLYSVTVWREPVREGASSSTLADMLPDTASPPPEAVVVAERVVDAVLLLLLPMGIGAVVLVLVLLFSRKGR